VVEGFFFFGRKIMENQYYKQLENVKSGDSCSLGEAIDQLRFNEQGLIPVIAQQFDTGEVLMMAWMNKESLNDTLKNGQMCYWSRSRNALWRKGESSGNTQALIELRIDCDGDTLLCKVDQTGPACHTDRTNCFYLLAEGEQLTVISDPIVD
jgi:phosphoribosyl-AMP cyclohydrolase